MIRMSTGLAVLAICAAGAAAAQDATAQLKARQGQFRILAINLGILGDMAQGKTEYDAEAAQAAADSLVGVSMVNQAPLWPEGSSEMDIDNTRAKAEIWDNFDDFASKWGALGEAAASMQTVAGNGAEALGPAMGGLGGACKACHDTYRAPQS
ncbi:c-type cytochrome [Salipiger thiooxidans]|uniref:c-type cytochrome n=1 Tax=Salipiger thiooxidans TaxID=282683 RepID=UPI001CD7C127|nr:cytochrome c [Salipiger thiooxidans]MBR9840756.1 cytochrome c [Paracoccaceae bacterium]MCA0850322.1 cytochrome c [Salipiger thiooxidans]